MFNYSILEPLNDESLNDDIISLTINGSNANITTTQYTQYQTELNKCIQNAPLTDNYTTITNDPNGYDMTRFNKTNNLILQYYNDYSSRKLECSLLDASINYYNSSYKYYDNEITYLDNINNTSPPSLSYINNQITIINTKISDLKLANINLKFLTPNEKNDLKQETDTEKY